MLMTTREYLNLVKPLIAEQKNFVADYGKCLSSLDGESYIYYPSVNSYCKDVCQQITHWQQDGVLDLDMTEQGILMEIENA